MQNHRGTVIPYATSAALITTVPVVRTAAVVFTNPADSNSSLNQQGHFSEGVLPTVTSSTNEARFGARIRPRELWLNLPGLILRCLKDWDEILSACSKLQCSICRSCNSGHLKKSRKSSLNSSPRSFSLVRCLEARGESSSRTQAWAFPWKLSRRTWTLHSTA